MEEQKICPFTLLFCKKESMPGEHPCALYDEKRQCCGLLRDPVLVFPATKKPDTWGDVFQSFMGLKIKEG